MVETVMSRTMISFFPLSTLPTDAFRHFTLSEVYHVILHVPGFERCIRKLRYQFDKPDRDILPMIVSFMGPP